MIEKITQLLDLLRTKRPLVHNITNFVVMNFTANALLSLGASPVMAHAVEEAGEMAGLAGAVVLNIGTLSRPWVDAMALAAGAAAEHHVPVVLDPVGAGATRFRTETARRLLRDFPIAVLRANGSEVLAVAGENGGTRGVDSVHGADDAQAAAVDLAKKHGMVVAVTGVEDFVTDGERSVRIANGHPLMARITGTGCTASALTGAFCAVEPDRLIAASAALTVFGIAGELAARTNPRPGTFQMLLLDGLDEIDGRGIRKRARVRASWL